MTPWTVAHWAPLPMGVPRQEYGSGVPFPSPQDLPHTGIEPLSATLQADSLPFEPETTDNCFSFHAEEFLSHPQRLIIFRALQAWDVANQGWGGHLSVPITVVTGIAAHYGLNVMFSLD